MAMQINYPGGPSPPWPLWGMKNEIQQNLIKREKSSVGDVENYAETRLRTPQEPFWRQK